MSSLRRHVQVHIPFTALWNGEIDHFTRHALNPEIAIDAAALERFTDDAGSSPAGGRVAELGVSGAALAMAGEVVKVENRKRPAANPCQGFWGAFCRGV